MLVQVIMNTCNYLKKKREIDEELLQCAMQTVGGEGRQGSYESEKMAYRNSTKPSSHPFDDKHLLEAHPKDGIYTSSHLFRARMKEAASDTLVHRYTPVGVKREPVGELDITTGERHTIEKQDTAEYHDTPNNSRKKDANETNSTGVPKGRRDSVTMHVRTGNRTTIRV